MPVTKSWIFWIRGFVIITGAIGFAFAINSFGVPYCIVIALGYLEAGVNEILIGIGINLAVSLLALTLDKR